MEMYFKIKKENWSMNLPETAEMIELPVNQMSLNEVDRLQT